MVKVGYEMGIAQMSFEIVSLVADVAEGQEDPWILRGRIIDLSIFERPAIVA